MSEDKPAPFWSHSPGAPAADPVAADGGAAFPRTRVGATAEPGMSLRDYFAAKAMAVLLAAGLTQEQDAAELLADTSVAAYKIADCMLMVKARVK